MSHRALWIVAFIVLVAAATYAMVGNPLDPFDNRRFSSQAWREGRPRTPMCGDIIEHVIRPGMSEKQVVELLGPPDRTRDGRAAGDKPLSDGRTFEYRIERWAFQSTDDAFLDVHFDSGDRVVTAQIYAY